jgi:hypothetical protein
MQYPPAHAFDWFPMLSHAAQWPPQQIPTPQPVPSTASLVGEHVGCPESQDRTPVLQPSPAAVHGAPLVHAPQVPWKQTWLAPHDVPLGTLLATQTGVPVTQLLTPVVHGLPVLHVAPAVQALQVPLSHTAFVPHDVPFGTFAVATQTAVPVAQLVVPDMHGSPFGLQETPLVHAPHIPSEQTSPLPHDVPLGTLPLETQVDVPFEQLVTPVWHGLPSGLQGAPDWHASASIPASSGIAPFSSETRGGPGELTAPPHAAPWTAADSKRQHAPADRADRQETRLAALEALTAPSLA